VKNAAEGRIDGPLTHNKLLDRAGYSLSRSRSGALSTVAQAPRSRNLNRYRQPFPLDRAARTWPFAPWIAARPPKTGSAPSPYEPPPGSYAIRRRPKAASRAAPENSIRCVESR